MKIKGSPEPNQVSFFIVCDDGKAPIAIEHWERMENCYIVPVAHNSDQEVTKEMVRESLSNRAVTVDQALSKESIRSAILIERARIKGEEY